MQIFNITEKMTPTKELSVLSHNFLLNYEEAQWPIYLIQSVALQFCWEIVVFYDQKSQQLAVKVMYHIKICRIYAKCFSQKEKIMWLKSQSCRLTSICPFNFYDIKTWHWILQLIWWTGAACCNFNNR